MKYSFDDLKGKVAVITGGFGILGMALTRGLAEAGVNLAVISRSADNPAKGEALAKEFGIKCLGISASTTDKAIPVTLTIPTTVNVDPHTFAGLTNLTKITIKTAQNVKSTTYDYFMTIGQLAFLECPNVTEFVIDDTTTQLEVPGSTISSFDDFKSATGLFNDELTLTYA